MDQDSSLNNSSFDFNSQAGVMSLLAAVRLSELSPADKNELRDLIFLYTNGGGDVSVRIALEQKLIANKIRPVALKNTAVAPAAPVLPFGSSRPAPVFKTPTATVQSQVTPAAPQSQYVPPPVVPVPTAAIPQPAAAIPQAQYVPPVTPMPQPAQYVPPPAAHAPQPVFSAPQPQNIQPPVVAAPSPAPQSVPVAPVVSVPPVNVNYLDRIREIKSAVNSKVGNPVNLVDINNEVGREYMNALLDAMKRLSGGAAGQIDVAMQRLEAAYQAVETAVAEHNKAQVVEESIPPQPVISTPQASPVIPAAFQPEINETPVAVEVPVPTPVAPVSVPVNTATITQSQEGEEIFPIVTEGPSGFEMSHSTPSVAAASLADEPKKVLTPQDLPTAASIATGSVVDSLHTKEVDDGLNQLLSDWSLFKKSGLFGTGPRGREHPLYKKVADLPIPLLLTGRFEGSTQEIKQSITDYMNGWRYEQGIIYEQGETFEHYLRRVIRQILDLQKKRRPA